VKKIPCTQRGIFYKLKILTLKLLTLIKVTSHIYLKLLFFATKSQVNQYLFLFAFFISNIKRHSLDITLRRCHGDYLAVLLGNQTKYRTCVLQIFMLKHFFIKICAFMHHVKTRENFEVLWF